MQIMQSTFNDLKKFLIKNGTRIDYSTDKSCFNERPYWADPACNKNYITYEMAISQDASRVPLYGYFEVRIDGRLTFNRYEDIILRYNESLDVIQMLEDTITLIIGSDSYAQWETLKFDENLQYIDKYSSEKVKKYYPLYNYMFFNTKKDIKTFIENYKVQYKKQYLFEISMHILEINQNIKDNNNEIRKFQIKNKKNIKTLKKLKNIENQIKL